MTTLLSVLAVLAVLLSSCAAGALLVYGGVWGVLRVQREDVRNLGLRLDTLERLAARRLGQIGVERKDAKRSAEEREIAELEKAIATKMAASTRPLSMRELPDVGDTREAHAAFEKAGR